MIAVPLFQVLHARKDRILHLPLLLGYLLVEFGVQTLKGRDVILLLGPLTTSCGVEIHRTMLARVGGAPTHNRFEIRRFSYRVKKVRKLTSKVHT